MAEFFQSSLGIAALVVIVLIVIYFSRPKPKIKGDEVNPVLKDEAAVSKVSREEEENNMDLEVTAAIMAALSYYLEVPASKFRIKSIKRTEGNIPAWRKESLQNR